MATALTGCIFLGAAQSGALTASQDHRRGRRRDDGNDPWENQRMRELLPIGFEDPQKLVDAYRARENRMHQYAQQSHDAGLRQKADAVINLDDKMLEAWRHTVPGSNDGSTSQDFQRAYTDYARQSQHAGQALQAACPT